MRERNDRSVAIERLTRRSDFRAVASGKRASGRAFVVQALQRGEGGSIRVGFTVARHVGNAVERNRVRRRLREIARLSACAGGSLLCPGHDYVLIGRRAALAAPFGEMVQELDAALRRIHGRAGPGAGATGEPRGEALHEAGSSSRPQKARRGGPKPPKSSKLRQGR